MVHRGLRFLSGALLLGLALSPVAQAQSLSFHLTYKDNSDNETGFRAYQVAGNPPVYTKVGEVAANVVSIPVTADVATSPCYIVRAFNGIGESPDSNTACALKPLAPGTTVIVVP